MDVEMDQSIFLNRMLLPEIIIPHTIILILEMFVIKVNLKENDFSQKMNLLKWVIKPTTLQLSTAF